MPCHAIAGLPDNVREQTAHRVAWSAVEKKYRKDENRQRVPAD